MSIYDKRAMDEILQGNDYQGRGIVIGKSASGLKAAIAYFIMGRSENSRNRVFRKENDDVMIYPYDESKVEDPTLIIYAPVRTLDNYLIVTNGDQTDTVRDFVREGRSFKAALETREFEPDGPNYTPRISGVMEVADGQYCYAISILKSNNGDPSCTQRFTFSYDVPKAGEARFISTYQGDGNPLPSFAGEPVCIEFADDAFTADIDTFIGRIWSALNEDNKVSLFARFIDIETGEVESRILNKNQ